jgi:N-acetylglucosaminyldiphosphoundecaprenol N-acetyl-beta-D-mannosaminyltransferase
MPKQEFWIERHRSVLSRAVIFSIGAAFDYEAGVQRAAPRWVGQIGLEWAFRLITQPVRLAHRYLLEPWSLLPVALEDIRTHRAVAAAAPNSELGAG